MTFELQNEVRDLRRRLDLAETKISQLEGRFEYISGQLRDVQLYLHARFDDIDKRFDDVNKRLDGFDRRFESVDRHLETIRLRMDNMAAGIDELPRVLAELLAKR